MRIHGTWVANDLIHDLFARTTEHSIFMTQIQLEHIRKLSFIPDKKSSLLLDPEEEEVRKTDDKPPSTPHIQFKKYASGFWSVKTHTRS